MKVMNYKGYAARIEFDAEDRIFVGHVAGISTGRRWRRLGRGICPPHENSQLDNPV